MKSKGPIVFLDRDGVINEFPGNGNYVTKVRDFHFIPRARDAIRNLTDAGCTLFVVSNQAGVGKGVFSQDKLNRITKKMMDGIKRSGGKIKKAFYCTHRSDQGCGCRKPEIDSIRKGLKIMKKTLRHAPQTFFVGDTQADIKAGINAGCKTIFVLSGREDVHYMRRWDDVEPDFIVKDLYEASKLITGNEDAQIIKRHSKLGLAHCNRRRRKLGINLHRRDSDSR